MPVYNVEKYLQDCIDSLVSQTMQGIELIFVNDASSDNSLQILKENQLKYPDLISIIDSRINLRQGGARNLGIKAAQGEYIAFVDSDDFVAPDMYEMMYNEIIEKNADAVYVDAVETPEFAQYKDMLEYIDKETSFRWSERLKRKSGICLNNKEKEDFISTGKYITCAIWKKSIIVDNELWFPEGLFYEDNYWNTLMSCYLNKVCFLLTKKYFYRIRGTSTSRKIGEHHVKDKMLVEEKLIDEAKKRGLFNNYYHAFEYVYMRRYAFNTYSFYVNYSVATDEKLIKGIFKNLRKMFPQWRKNPYRKERTSLRARIKEDLVSIFPMCILKIEKFVKK